MVSGVLETDWTARNCERRAVTSDAVKPALRSRSKPRGAGVVVGGGGEGCVIEEGWRGESCFWRSVEDRLDSAERSVSERAMSPIEQWM
jgi:hypothetical protein